MMQAIWPASVSVLKSITHRELPAPAVLTLFPVQNIAVFHTNRTHGRIPAESGSGAFPEFSPVYILVSVIDITGIEEQNAYNTCFLDKP